MKFEEQIGNTPLAQRRDHLFLKLEYTNFTGSVKDRAALAMIRAGERAGILQPGSTIIEPTSGNMGISLAAIASHRGYGCILVMPDSMSIERQQRMVAWGAQVVRTPAAGGMQLAVDKAEELLRQIPASWSPRQFENPANPLAHYHTTGPEIWMQTQGKVDIFVAGVGTGGTITGVARYLKEMNPKVQIVAVEPSASPLLSKGVAGGHGIQGIGPNFVPQILDQNLIDEIATVTDEDAIAAARVLGREGYPCGISSGAAACVAHRLALDNPPKTVVALLPDSADRYRSLGLLP